MADGTDIDVNEVRFGVVADSAAVHGEGRVTDLDGGNAGDADVDGFGLHVFAVERDSAAVFTQVVVTPGSAITADDVDFAAGMAETGHEIVQKVEFADVVGLHVSSAMVAQEMIELGDGGGQILIADAVDDVNMLARMKVIETKTVLLRLS